MKDAETRTPTRAKDEIERLGDEIYERDIRRHVEADHVAEVVEIDVESGQYAVADTALAAADALRERYPPLDALRWD